jgi:RNAse (barnase) inhibitor barstar
MRHLIVDAADWQTPADGWRDLCAALGAPDWHGRNLDALTDSLRGGINAVEPPFTLTIINLPAPLHAFGQTWAMVFAAVRDEGQDVALTFR